VAELADQAHELPVVERDDRGAAGVMDDLQVDHVAVGQAHGFDVERYDAPFEDLPDLFNDC